MFEVTSLGSGSSGNAFLVRTPGITVMVDCGLSAQRLAAALASLGLTMASIDALLVSHEHIDHIRELPRFSAAGTQILSTLGTAMAANIPRPNWEELAPGRPRQIADVEIAAIAVSHDAAEPCGFLIRTAAGSVTVITDLGCSSSAAAEAIQESHLVILEANHDVPMLKRGPYPVHLQRRILSNLGHLSNDGCGDLLVSALRRSPVLPTVWLAHLSETNNRPQLAKKAVQHRLAQAGIHLNVHPLPRREASATWRPETAQAGAAQLTLDFAL